MIHPTERLRQLNFDDFAVRSIHYFRLTNEVFTFWFRLVIICETLSRLTVGPSGCPSSPKALFLFINSFVYLLTSLQSAYRINTTITVLNIRLHKDTFILYALPPFVASILRYLQLFLLLVSFLHLFFLFTLLQ